MNKFDIIDVELFCKEKIECLDLSPAELRVARLLSWGYTQKEIADKLNRSIHTIATELKNIYKQLGIHKETDLTRWYIFKEYSIMDNPFKKILAVFFLVLSLTLIFSEQSTVRVFRSNQITSRNISRPARARRYINIFEPQPSFA
jgi:DNA-binding CsgD family transcriptional regulator